MDPNNKKDQKNNQNRNRNMRGVVTLIIWALVLTVVFNYINAYSNNLTKRPAAMRSRTASSSTSFRRIRWRS